MAGAPGDNRRLIAWRPVEAGTATEAVDRGLVALALAWQALWALADSRAWPLEMSGGWVTLAMLVSLGLWALLLVSHLTGRVIRATRARALNVGGLVLASIAITAAVVRTPEHDWNIASSWAVLPAGVAGLLLGWRWALGVVLVVSASVGIAAFELLGPSVNEASAHDVLYSGYALSVGVVTIAARHVLLRDAAAADRAAAEASAAHSDLLAARMVETSAQREQRVLHETVLNTLTAIVRGGTGTPALRQSLTRRCWESARVLRSLRGRQASGSPHVDGVQRLDDDVRGQLDEVRASGALVVVECEPLAVPLPVYHAVLTATREALVNASRHAEASTVTVRARQVDDTVTVEIRDDGRGFWGIEDAVTRGRFGLAGGIVAPLAEVGGMSRIDSSPGVGTAITLTWRAHGSQQRGEAQVSSAAFAIPMLLAFGAYSAAVFGLGLPDALMPVLDLVAFALFVMLAVLVGWSSRRGPLPWWIVLVSTGVAPLVYQLQAMSTADATAHEGWQEWASGAIGAVFVVLIAAGPRHAWLVVLPAWLLIQGDVLTELLAAGTAILLAAALFARSTRRSAEALASAREVSVEQMAAERAATAQVSRIRQRFAALDESTAVELLTGIADGELDPDAPVVRTWAELEEQFIRTILRIDPGHDDVHALVTDLAIQARRSGVLLDIALPGDRESRTERVGWLRPTLIAAVAAAEPGGRARLTVQHQADVEVLRLVVPVRAEARALVEALEPAGHELAPGDPDMLWEIVLPVDHQVGPERSAPVMTGQAQ